MSSESPKSLPVCDRGRSGQARGGCKHVRRSARFGRLLPASRVSVNGPAALFPEGAKWPRRGLVVRTPSIGGAENAASLLSARVARPQGAIVRDAMIEAVTGADVFPLVVGPEHGAVLRITVAVYALTVRHGHEIVPPVAYLVQFGKWTTGRDRVPPQSAITCSDIALENDRTGSAPAGLSLPSTRSRRQLEMETIAPMTIRAGVGRAFVFDRRSG